MSHLTARLLKVRPARTVWRTRWAEITSRLLAEYGLPKLGNFRDPVREIFYILLSAKTADAQYRVTERRLRREFPNLLELSKAPLKRVRACIESGGLAAIRSRQIVKAAKLLVMEGGPNPAKHLRSLDANDAFEFLTRLPGIGAKSALCVMMYSLDFDVFPVDVNVMRIAERLGAIPPKLDHTKSQKRLARQLPEGVSKALHIGLVEHGRKVCTPRRPKCNECVLLGLCKLGRGVVLNQDLSRL